MSTCEPLIRFFNFTADAQTWLEGQGFKHSPSFGWWKREDDYLFEVRIKGENSRIRVEIEQSEIKARHTHG